MRKKIRFQAGQSLLFVCFGNTCRSPMAEGLAAARLGSGVAVASAGFSPEFTHAQPEAVAVLAEMFGIDISSHIPRGLDERVPDRFDWVVVLDRFVFQHLRFRMPHLRDFLLLWDVEDPFGGDLEAYREAAQNLDRRIRKNLLPPSGATFKPGGSRHFRERPS